MYNNIFDSHAHYDDARFDTDRDNLILSLPESGIAAVMAAACTLDSSEASAKLADKYGFIWCSAGIHPHDASSAPADMEEKLSAFASYEKCMAIGETGLDYHYDFSPRDKQKEVFERHLALARELDLPVIVHEREAGADVLELLKKYRPKGVVHCYLGSVEMAEQLAGLGFYIGFTGAVTFKSAKHTLDALKVVPPEKLLIETDCPYMAPVPLRGQRCDSSMLPHTAVLIAETLKISVQELFNITCENACRLFDISGHSVIK